MQNTISSNVHLKNIIILMLIHKILDALTDKNIKLEKNIKLKIKDIVKI
jgi:hypothetical protein